MTETKFYCDYCNREIKPGNISKPLKYFGITSEYGESKVTLFSLKEVCDDCVIKLNKLFVDFGARVTMKEVEE